MESINNQDEATLLGYFESAKSTFLLKFILLVSHLKEDKTKTFIDPNSLPNDAITSVKKYFDDSLFYKALENGNEELRLNLVEDLITSLFISCWNVFEQITKDLTVTNYSTSEDDLSLCYQNGKFQFNKREKKDIELFYYIRNSICHYNGAYFAYKKINHRYAGKDFKSEGHEGNKIKVDFNIVWKMANDLEKLTMKAWNNARKMP